MGITRPAGRILACALAAALTALGIVPSSRAVPAGARYQIICHPSNPAVAVDRQFLEDAFLKKVREWPSGAGAHPVDLHPNSAIRRQFSEGILKRSVEAVRIFWQQRIFAGRELPPPEFGDDDAVVKHLLNDPGGVGYVSTAANLKGAKVLTVR